jgi:hypothetical protein
MSEADAKTFFNAAQNVMRHYSIATTQKAVDWMTFASVSAIMYAPRVVALQKRMQDGPRRPEPQTAPMSATVFQFNPPVSERPVRPNGAAAQPQSEPVAAVEPEIHDIEQEGPVH